MDDMCERCIFDGETIMIDGHIAWMCNVCGWEHVMQDPERVNG